MPVRSNYNFVPAPLEEEVFKPKWAELVSHDLPFSDGESGEIEIQITAETAIFIRNGHLKDQVDPHFSHQLLEDNSKRYFIPATSLKGMFRSVMEILSYSRIKQIDNNRYSYRNLVPNSLYMENYSSNEVRCGWLYADKEEEWWIEDCGKPIHIHHQTVDNLLGTDFRKKFLKRNPAEKSAILKYKQVPTGRAFTYRFKTKLLNEENPVDERLLAIPDQQGQEGTIVFTGQSGARKEKEGEKSTGKVHEFVFLAPTTKKDPLKISNQQQKDFRFIYLEHDSQNISPDWEHWKEQLEKGKKIPIFFTPADESNKEKDVLHFGLAFMYKMPYAKSIHEILPYRAYRQDQPDLTELIFGQVNAEMTPLKGRVMFAHAFSKNAMPFEEAEEEILAGPKASYLPFYLDQDLNKDKAPGQKERKIKAYKDYMNENSVIRGFKRYPIHKYSKTGDYTPEQRENPNVFSTFIPLKAGAKFTGKIRFHNLREVEIGALLSSITFHNNSKSFFHSLGGAKPFGYGKVSIQITSTKNLKAEVTNYLLAFEQLMQEQCRPDWLNSPPLQELFAMASPSKTENLLKYPQIKIPGLPPREANEFKVYEKEKAFLESYRKSNHLPQLISITEKVKINEDFNSTDFDFNKESLKKLKAQLKALEVIHVPSPSHANLIEVIKHIYKHDGESRRKLNKPYEWQNTIRNWLGQEKANALYSELTGKPIEDLQ